MKSQIAANRLAEKRLEEVLVRYGRTTVEQAIERIFDQTEAGCRAERLSAACTSDSLKSGMVASELVRERFVM